MPAILAQANFSILYAVDRDACRIALHNPLLSHAADNGDYEPRDKREKPDAKVNHPPPPANGEPPQATVAGLVFRLCFGDAPAIFLQDLDVDVLTSTARTYHLYHSFCFNIP